MFLFLIVNYTNMKIKTIFIHKFRYKNPNHQHQPQDYHKYTFYENIYFSLKINGKSCFSKVKYAIVCPKIPYNSPKQPVFIHLIRL